MKRVSAARMGLYCNICKMPGACHCKKTTIVFILKSYHLDELLIIFAATAESSSASATLWTESRGERRIDQKDAASSGTFSRPRLPRPSLPALMYPEPLIRIFSNLRFDHFRIHLGICFDILGSVTRIHQGQFLTEFSLKPLFVSHHK